MDCATLHHLRSLLCLFLTQVPQAFAKACFRDLLAAVPLYLANVHTLAEAALIFDNSSDVNPPRLAHEITRDSSAEQVEEAAKFAIRLLRQHILAVALKGAVRCAHWRAKLNVVEDFRPADADAEDADAAAGGRVEGDGRPIREGRGTRAFDARSAVVIESLDDGLVEGGSSVSVMVPGQARLDCCIPPPRSPTIIPSRCRHPAQPTHTPHPIHLPYPAATHPIPPPIPSLFATAFPCPPLHPLSSSIIRYDPLSPLVIPRSCPPLWIPGGRCRRFIPAKSTTSGAARIGQTNDFSVCGPGCVALHARGVASERVLWR